MRLFVFLFLLGAAQAEDFSGELVNGTKGGPGKADSVQLILLEQSMNIIGTQNDVEGKFKFSSETALDGKSLLLQASKDGVLYSLPLKWPTSEKIELKVYDTVEELQLRTTIPNIALYAYAQTLDIAFFYNINNASDPPVTLHRAQGNFSFDLIHGFSDLEASTRSGTMPLRQQLEVEGDRATLAYPLKPGITQLMVRTRHPYNATGENTITITLPEGQRQMKILGLPTSLDVKGDAVEFISEDTAENMKLYEFTPAAGQRELVLKISGKPLDKPMDETRTSSQAPQKNPHADGATPKIENRPHFLQPYRWTIVASILAVFGIFTFIGLRR